MTAKTIEDHQTRQRLLEAAGASFSTHGYQHATIRDICKQAGTNVASVHYHFGDKQHLYEAVLRHHADALLQRFPVDWQAEHSDDAALRLRAFIRAMLYRFFSEGSSGTYAQLMAWEMLNPTPGLDMLVEEIIRPMADYLESLVRSLLGPSASGQDVRLCALSVIGQCLLYKGDCPVIERLYGDVTEGEDAVETIAEHITRFSLDAIRLRKDKERE